MCLHIRKEEDFDMEMELHSESINHFFEAVLSLENKEECYRFFEDVCTIKELAAIAQRVEVAKLLHEELTYIDIAKETGASTATISRVNRTLRYGKQGLELVIERMKDQQ